MRVFMRVRLLLTCLENVLRAEKVPTGENQPGKLLIFNIHAELFMRAFMKAFTVAYFNGRARAHTRLFRRQNRASRVLSQHPEKSTRRSLIVWTIDGKTRPRVISIPITSPRRQISICSARKDTSITSVTRNIRSRHIENPPHQITGSCAQMLFELSDIITI